MATVSVLCPLTTSPFKADSRIYSANLRLAFPGDETLRLIVRGIIDCIRSSDILIRYGGDEFLLFFPSIPSDIFASRLEEIRRRVESITVPGFPNFKPTVSIGGVYGAHPLADAIHRADLKMYDAKHERNHVSVSILPPPTTGF